MTTDDHHTTSNDFAESLLRNFARPPGDTPETTPGGDATIRKGGPRLVSEPSGLDENDLAAFARGNLSPGRAALVREALSHSPEFQEALAFARVSDQLELTTSKRKPGRQSLFRRPIVAAAAAAAVLLLAVTAVFYVRPAGERGLIDKARTLLAANEPAQALTTLRSLDEQSDLAAEARQLRALARFALGEPEPQSASLDRPVADFLPISDAELKALTPSIERSSSPGGVSMLAPRGKILDLRPEIAVQNLRESVLLRVVRSSDQSILFEDRLAPPSASERSLVRIPSNLPDLEPGKAYGVEVRSAGGTLLAYSDFSIADTTERDLRLARIAELKRLLPSSNTLLEALAHFHLRHHLDYEAARLLSRLPKDSKSRQRLLDLCERRLGWR